MEDLTDHTLSPDKEIQDVKAGPIEAQLTTSESVRQEVGIGEASVHAIQAAPRPTSRIRFLTEV